MEKTASSGALALPGSPALHPYPATTFDEDIQEILGAMEGNREAVEETQATTKAEEIPSQPPGPCDSHPANEDEADDESKAQARSERKRCREKQRRHDVNKQFSDLTALLRKIEAEEDDEGFPRVPLPSNGFNNRVDLIARTSVVLERMHEGSKRRKLEIERLKKDLQTEHKMAEDIGARLKEATMYQYQPPSKPVMMMVPMMVDPFTGNPTAGGAFPQMPQQPTGMMPGGMMNSQMMMMPQMMAQQQAAPAATAPTASTAAPNGQQPQMQMPIMGAGATGQPQQPHQPMQQLMAQQQQQQMAMMPQMMMPQYSPMMFQQPTTATTTTTGPSTSPTTQQQQQDQKASSTGGNLAHCA